MNGVKNKTVYIGGGVVRHKVDILNFEWATDSRDTNITDPILVSLRDRFGYTITAESIWYAFFKLLKYRPKLLLMSNEVGAFENYFVCRAAYALGIKTVVLISEGLNYECKKEEDQKKLEIELMFGHNTDHKRIWDMKLLWSESTRDSFYKYVDESKDYNLKVSGATGFDSYKLLSFKNDEILRQAEKTKYKKIIILVGFAFDLLPTYNLEILHMNKTTVDSLYGQRFKIRDIYKELIEKNQDILFILKHHPGSMNLDDTEFSDIMNKYDNTLTIHKEHGIRDLLGLSDIIIAFDSTVCMEGWCLGKPSLLINPEDVSFPRSWCYRGSVILRSYKELSQCIDEYYTNGSIKAFDELKTSREEIIRKQIQFDDGFNYLRAAKLIDAEMQKQSTHPSDKKAKAILIKGLVREVCDFLIENQPIPVVKKKSRNFLKERSARYKKKNRIASMEEYKIGIDTHEKNNEEKVFDILNNYVG